MGDYVAMRGTVRIKPALIEVFKKHLTKDENGTRLPWREMQWETGTFDLQGNPIFEQLAHPANDRADNMLFHNQCTSSFGGEEKNFDHRLTFTDEGELEFLCGSYYNHWDNHLLFCALLPVIADTWDVQLDRHELQFNGPEPAPGDAWGFMDEEMFEETTEEVQKRHGIYRCINDAVSLGNKYVNEKMKTRYSTQDDYLFEESMEVMQLITTALHSLDRTSSYFKTLMTNDKRQPIDAYLTIFKRFGTNPVLGRIPSMIVHPTLTLRPPVCVEQVKFFSRKIVVSFCGEPKAREFDIEDTKGIAQAIHEFIT